MSSLVDDGGELSDSDELEDLELTDRRILSCGVGMDIVVERVCLCRYNDDM